MYQIGTNKGTAYLWIPPEQVEPSAMEQIHAMMEHPRLFKHVAIMPDVHAGIGATVGSVIPLRGAVIPAAVGVDIGCGMCSVKSSAKVVEISPLLKQIYESIITRIPRGFNHRTQSQKADVHQFGHKEVIASLRDYEKYSASSLFIQLGTLGGGK